MNTDDIENQIDGGSRPGHVYALFDGPAGLCKIGCSKSADVPVARPQGRSLAWVASIKVDDRMRVKKQLLESFEPMRAHGDWFEAPVDQVIERMASHPEAREVSLENLSRLGKYIMASRKKDWCAMRLALKGPSEVAG